MNILRETNCDGITAPRSLEAAALSAMADDRRLIQTCLNAGLAPVDLFKAPVYRTLADALFTNAAAPSPAELAIHGEAAVNAIDDLECFRERDPARGRAAVLALISQRAEESLQATCEWVGDAIAEGGADLAVVRELRRALDRVLPDEDAPALRLVRAKRGAA